MINSTTPPTPPDIRLKLGQNLKRHRRKKRLTQSELASASGIDRSYISDVERGVGNPTVLVVQQLAEALGISPALLLA